jgi:thymidylate synthase (FAD)
MKNFLDLRASGSAWFQIQWLSEAIMSATPDKYLKLIRKDRRD